MVWRLYEFHSWSLILMLFFIDLMTLLKSLEDNLKTAGLQWHHQVKNFITRLGYFGTVRPQNLSTWWQRGNFYTTHLWLVYTLHNVWGGLWDHWVSDEFNHCSTQLETPWWISRIFHRIPALNLDGAVWWWFSG